MKCSETAGFLIPRPCRNEATVQCNVCQKWICGEHTASLPQGGLGCTSCAADRNVGPGVQQRQFRNQYGYNNTWFSGGALGMGLGMGMGMGMGRGYTHQDYDAFEDETLDEEERQRRERLEGS